MEIIPFSANKPGQRFAHCDVLIAWKLIKNHFDFRTPGKRQHPNNFIKHRKLQEELIYSLLIKLSASEQTALLKRATI